ncbi:MAG: maltodextrin glucosidase [Oscillospiraceae bacterium]|nr:maltodextrin glucosidase [Oscillospiraceae bacterium]
MQWFQKATFYHIYPLGYCGCEKEHTDSPAEQGRILKISQNAEYISSLGFTAVYLGPVFESDRHGYDTRDYTKIDSRLGSNDDFKAVCDALHKNGIRVVVDGVFNHVGRGFWAFEDVRKNGLSSRYRDWFYIREGNNGYNDGFYYEGWEGHYELVKLNLHNPEVKEYIKSCVTGWVRDFGIDGIRLDVAYCLDLQFLRELRGHCKWLKNDFWLMGETLHGDYNKWMNDEMLDSVTNYECYKGIYSSFNSMNMFEISYSINRQFGSEHWCIYRGKHLYTFVDNHDVSRIATILTCKEHIFGVYTLLYTMPGIPSVYYMSEFGEEGDKSQGDDALRLPFERKQDNAVTSHIRKLNNAYKQIPALSMGDYRQLTVTNKQYAFSRSFEGSEAVIMINADSAPFTMNVGKGGMYTDALSGEKCDLSGNITLGAFECRIFSNTDVSLDEVKTAPVEVAETPIEAVHETKTIAEEQPAEMPTEMLTVCLKKSTLEALTEKAKKQGMTAEEFCASLLSSATEQ